MTPEKGGDNGDGDGDYGDDVGDNGDGDGDYGDDVDDSLPKCQWLSDILTYSNLSYSLSHNFRSKLKIFFSNR